jgi:2-methylcitrate dehydratase PrpD
MEYGGVRLDAFAPERLTDPKIRAVMPRISVSLDEECEAAFPGRRSAKVSIRLRDGRELFRYQPTRKGDPDAPLSDTDLDEKFLELTSPVLGTQAAKDFLRALWTGSALPGELTLIRR